MVKLLVTVSEVLPVPIADLHGGEPVITARNRNWRWRREPGTRLSRAVVPALLPIAAALALAACATTPAEPKVRVVEVKVPVAVACVPKTLGEAPSYPDSDAAIKAAPGSGDMLQLLAAGRLLRNQRLAEVETVISACR